MRVEIKVYGRPAPGGSKSGFVNKRTGKVNMAPASKYTKPWMINVAAVAKLQYWDRPMTGPVSLMITFKLLRPKSHWTKTGDLSSAGRKRPHPTVKPDLTKLLRSTEDALTGIIWKDDAQVVRQSMAKRYCHSDELPGAEIIVESLENYE